MFVPVWCFVLLSVLACAGAFVFFRAISYQKQRAQTFRALAEGASDGLVLMETDSKIIWANPAYSKIMRREMDQILGMYPLEFALPPDLAVSKEEARNFVFEPEDERFGSLTRVRNIRGDGSEFTHEFSHATIPWGDDSFRVILVGRDVSENVERENALIQAQNRLELQSRTDALTQLANRSHFREMLAEAMVSQNQPFVVMLIDMNGFKAINDTHGHHAGDAILCHFSNLLKAFADPSWTCARMGGDEFAVLAPNISTLEDGKTIAEELIKATETPMTWQSGMLSASLSVGVAVDEGEAAPDGLLTRADVALYEAKAASDSPVAVYDQHMHARHLEKEALQNSAGEAIHRKEICFYLQPIVDVRLGRVIKFETLARWNRPCGDVLLPGQFISIFDQLGLSEELDACAIANASETLAALDKARLTDVGLSVNISANALNQDFVTDQLIWHADAGSLDPARICIEVLETTAFFGGEDGPTFPNVERLRAAGYAVYLDDFGMGFAGLAHLASLNVSGLKIDRQLTSAVDSDPASKSIVLATTRLAQDLGLDVVAEGVETEDQIETMTDLGCDVFQGYAISRPMPRDDAIIWASEWLAAYHNDPVAGEI